MATQDAPLHDTRQEQLVRRLVEARLAEEHPAQRYALFFVSGEGELLPGGYEEASGHLIDEHGHVFAFWFGWDPTQAAPALTEWYRDEPEEHWLRSDEYRRARRAVGLTAA